MVAFVPKSSGIKLKQKDRFQFLVQKLSTLQVGNLKKECSLQYQKMPKFELAAQKSRDLSLSHPPESSHRMVLNRDNLIRKCHSDLHQKYEFGDKIGEGSFGQVFKVVHKQLGVVRALKIIGKTPEWSTSSHDAYEELEILKRLDHPNVLKVYEYFESDCQWFIVTQFFQGKELFDQIIQEKKLSERKAALIFAQVCKAVAYIHAHSIVHRDIKPENILVRKSRKKASSSPSPEYEYEIKLIDWGLGSRSVKEMMRKCGTPQYCAPQILEGMYGLECDLWSLGVLLYVMLVGRFPFKGATVHETLHLVSRAHLTFKSPEWQQIGIQAKYLISCLLRKDPKQRKQATQILKSEWILSHVQSSRSHQSLQQLQNQQSSLKQTLIRLKQVTLDNKFQAVVINFIHNYMTAELREKKLKKEFEALDLNQDGVLSFEELVKGYEGVYPYLARPKLEEIVDQIFSNIDLDGSGKIEYSEFITFATKISKKFTQKQLKQVFSLLDEDGNGRINKKQISQILMYEKGAQSQQFDRIIDEIDLDGDGSINLEQFIKNINKAVTKVIRQERKSQSKRKSLEKGKGSKEKSLEKTEEERRVTRQYEREKNQEHSSLHESSTKEEVSLSKQKQNSESQVSREQRQKSKSKSRPKTKPKEKQKGRPKPSKSKDKPKDSRTRNH